MLTVVIRKAGGKWSSMRAASKALQGHACELPLYSPVTPVLGPAPAHTESRGGPQLGMLSRDVGVQGGRVIISICSCLSNFSTVIKICDKFYENEGEKNVWLLTENSKHECVKQGGGGKWEKRFLSLIFPHLTLHAQNVQCCVHSGGVILEASQEDCRSPLQHSLI